MELNDYKSRYDPEWHTMEWLNSMTVKHVGNMAAFARDIKKPRKTLYSWIDKIRTTNDTLFEAPKVPKSQQKTKQKTEQKQQSFEYKVAIEDTIPTIQQMLDWLESKPGHVDHAYFFDRGHMARNRALARAVLDVVRDMRLLKT